MTAATPSIDEYIAIFRKYGDPGERYLRQTYLRMCITKSLALQGVGVSSSLRLLDIGAHWLHNSALYAMDGVSVTAAELDTIGEFSTSPLIIGIAKEFGIRLVTYNDLSNPVELNLLPADSFDIILFTEILEHITFNPVKMWEALFRLVAIGGKIIVTTPNYHFITNVVKDLIRPLVGKSAGISVDEIIGLHTYGHHWKLYSSKDIKRYFALLSPDFLVKRICYYTYTPPVDSSALRRVKRFFENTVSWFREALYVEVGVEDKNHGIVAKPGWF
jgi:2-polyprenyl-6-hydroxyphenyl methylase/3-demethylubiquinone-9 3-methyltransferase